MAIQLTTLGGLRAVGDDGELDWLLSQRARAALFVYLAVERQVSRESVIALFWPEGDAESTRHALRQSLYQLRKAVGGAWIESRAHELRVSQNVRTDVLAFGVAIERGEAALAAQLYGGPFLDGVHLVDLTSWENWVDLRRAHYARAFRRACRSWHEERRAAGDLAGAIEAAERWVARDPSDDEGQHRLIETLGAAGERAGAIGQYESYARLLEQDGLRPLDETLELVERLRSDPSPWPARRTEDASAAGPVSAVPAPAEFPTTTARRRAPLLAAVVLVLIAASLWGLTRRQSPGPATSPAAVAVLPFSVHGGAAVAYVGEGIVNLLAAALDGAGSLRPVDTRAVFAALARDGGAAGDAQQGGRLAERLGAGLFVLGDVVEGGDQLHIEAAVYETGEWASPRARAVVSGGADSLFDLVDRLAARLLAGLGDPSADRLLRTAALTTTSLPAFKAYLEGEALMRAGQLERAAEAYVTAAAYDSTFAFAHYRLALAREWAPLPGAEDAASAAARHGQRLSARDRNLLGAFRMVHAGDVGGAERAYRAILARYPDDVDAWVQLGEVLFHHGPLYGRPLQESEAAWRTVVSHEPRSLFALPHLARIAAVERRPAALDSMLAPFGPDELRADRRLAEMVLLRAVASGDTAAAHAGAKEMATWEELSVWRVAAWITAFNAEPAATATVVQQLMGPHQSPELRADLHWFTSLLHLAGGRARDAQATLAGAVRMELAAPQERRRRGFEAVTEWLAATLPLPYADSVLAAVRRRAAAPQTSKRGDRFENGIGLGTPIRVEPLRQYTLGILSLRLSDPASAAAAGAALQRFAASGDANGLVRDLDRGLRARLAAHEGRTEDALGLLQALELGDSQGDIAVTPFVARASERFLRAELLASLGRDVEALQWFASLGHGSVTEIPLRAPAHLRQAQIHERRGDRDEAARHYARFIDFWRDSDPEFRPLVDEARRRLDALGHRTPS